MLDPLPCNDGTEWTPEWKYECVLRERFLNIGPEWQKMLFWLQSNPKNRKTRKGMTAFVGNWMNRSGVVRTKITIPKDILERNKPVDKGVGRNWIEQIKAVLRGREPGTDETC